MSVFRSRKLHHTANEEQKREIESNFLSFYFNKHSRLERYKNARGLLLRMEINPVFILLQYLIGEMGTREQYVI
jgi:hypothetical protein